MLQDTFESILDAVRQASLNHYGERLISFAVFGSVARGTARTDSDIDILLVIDPLPNGRMTRMREWETVEAAVAAALERAKSDGVNTSLSPVFKTPAELRRGSLLFLDLTDQARILFDRDGTLSGYLERLRQRLRELGARRIYKGGGYYWLLKPDFKFGEEISL